VLVIFKYAKVSFLIGEFKMGNRDKKKESKGKQKKEKAPA